MLNWLTFAIPISAEFFSSVAAPILKYCCCHIVWEMCVYSPCNFQTSPLAHYVTRLFILRVLSLLVTLLLLGIPTNFRSFHLNPSHLSQPPSDHFYTGKTSGTVWRQRFMPSPDRCPHSFCPSCDICILLVLLVCVCICVDVCTSPPIDCWLLESRDSISFFFFFSWHPAPNFHHLLGEEVYLTWYSLLQSED